MKKAMPALVVLWILTIFSFAPPINAQDIPGGLVYSVPGMDKAEVRTNVVYKKDGLDEMKLDIYMPPNLATNDRRPAVFFIHGGPLGAHPSPRAKEWPIFKSYGRLMAALGFAGITLDHRYVSSSSKDMETSFSDVEAAIQYVRANATSYHVDPDRIALWAFSGGGPHISIGLRGNTPYIRCLVSYYGILDPTSSTANTGETPQAMVKYSPVDYLLKPNEFLPSVLIARAGLERTAGLNSSVDRFVSRMLALGGDVNLLVHPFGRHGFDGSDNDDQSRDIIAATIAFIKGRLNRPAAFEMKKAFLALMASGNIDAAREFVRTKLNASENKSLIDALVSEEQFADVGFFLSGQKNASAATKVFEWMIELHPNSINGYCNLAYLYGMSGQTDKAIAIAKKALTLFETDKTLNEEQKKVGRQQIDGLLKMLQVPPTK
jgi:acetyl esterase/lipase